MVVNCLDLPVEWIADAGLRPQQANLSLLFVDSAHVLGFGRNVKNLIAMTPVRGLALDVGMSRGETKMSVLWSRGSLGDNDEVWHGYVREKILEREGCSIHGVI